MIIKAPDDVQGFCERLAEKCRNSGLNSAVLGSGRVRVHAPGSSSRLAEVVRCAPDALGRLSWWWSWAEPICRAAEIDLAVARIAYVVSPGPHP